MYNLVLWKNRESIMNKLIEIFCSIMILIFRKKDIAGWMMSFFLHYLPYYYLFMNIFLYPIASWMVWSCIITYISNIFFRGCLCFRIERKLFEDRSWFGPYGLMDFLGIKVITYNVIWAFHIFITIIFLIMLIKIFIFKSVEKNFSLF